MTATKLATTQATTARGIAPNQFRVAIAASGFAGLGMAHALRRMCRWWRAASKRVEP